MRNLIKLKHLIPAALLGLAIGIFLYSLTLRPAAGVGVQPEAVEIAVDPLQYQAVNVHLQVSNRSGKPARILRADTSCGCASLVTRGGIKMFEPLDLPAGGAIPWQVVIHTQGRIGAQDFMVYFEVETGGVVSRVTSTIKTRIRPALAIDPAAVEFHDVAPGEVRKASVVLFDGYADSGYEVAQTQVSDPQRVQAKVVPIFNADTFNFPDSASSAASLRSRLRLEVSYTSPAHPRAIVQDEVVLEPKNGLHPRISVPILCRMTPPAYEVSPSTLSFATASLGQIVRRTVRCRIRPGIDSAIRVLSAPSWAKVTVDRVDPLTADLQVTLDVPQSAPGPQIEPIVLGCGPSDPNRFSIPIEFLGPP